VGREFLAVVAVVTGSIILHSSTDTLVARKLTRRLAQSAGGAQMARSRPSQ
jgi:hypothetical protein